MFSSSESDYIVILSFGLFCWWGFRSNVMETYFSTRQCNIPVEEKSRLL